jgi:hypothetical protein
MKFVFIAKHRKISGRWHGYAMGVSRSAPRLAELIAQKP